MAKKAWVASVNMGYGHQRTAFPLKYLAVDGKIINANDYEGIPGSDKKIWENSRRFYEFISRFQRVPLLGKISFSLYDQFQKIFSFYPQKDLSASNFQLKQIYRLIKKGWGKDLISKLQITNNKLQTNFPLISTFFIPAFMAEEFNYPGEIFCVICDADIARTWAPLNPKKSRIKYFAPTERVVERLKLYGIKAKNIYLTGYPLPKENINENDLKERLLNLDPEKRYFEKYKTLIKEKLGILPNGAFRSLTILFSVGGAGAQKEMGIKILRNLDSEVKKGKMKLILSAGIKEKVKKYFEKNILKNNKNIEIIFGDTVEDYFQKFNQALRKADILWTKPSELSFYSALGIPIIITPPLGSQEKFNRRWLLKSGFGLAQGNPNYISQWLSDWIKNGYLAEAAMEGFVEGEKMGTFNIEKIIEKCSG